MLDIPTEKSSAPLIIEESKTTSIPEINIYDEKTIYIAPMYILQTESFRSLTLSVSLPELIN